MTKTRSSSASSKRPHPRGTASSRRGLRNPAAVPSEMTTQLFSVIPFIIKATFVLGVVYLGVRAYKNRFVAMKYRADLDPANITDAQAQARANAIYASIGWVSNDFDTVADAISGLNYNGFVKLYNAFGHHTGTLLSGDLDLIEWCKNQFTDSELEQLRFITNGAFF